MGEERTGCGIVLLVVAFLLGAGVMYACGPHSQSAPAACCPTPTETPAWPWFAATPIPPLAPATPPTASSFAQERVTRYTDARGQHRARVWSVGLLQGEVVIAGGYVVDGMTSGAYEAIAGPGDFTITVTDGFITILAAGQAKAAFCSAVREAIANHREHQFIIPLPQWGPNPCGL